MVGAKVNLATDGEMYPIHQASELGLTPLIPMLISCGADINRKCMFENTCLHLSSKEGHLGTVLELILRYVYNRMVLGSMAVDYHETQSW